MPVNYQLGKVYKITNTVNNTVYIGSTAQPRLSTRMCGHRRDAVDLTRTSAWNIAMRTIGANNFTIILDHVFPCNSKDELVAEEMKTMDRYVAAGVLLYNSIIGGKATDAMKAKLSAAQTGRKHPDAVKVKIAAAHKGVKFTDEHKKNLSNAKKGQGFSFGCVGYYEGDYPRWIFQYYDKQGISHAKSFSVRKFGHYGGHWRAEELRKQIYPEYGTEEDIACDDLGYIEWD